VQKIRYPAGAGNGGDAARGGLIRHGLGNSFQHEARVDQVVQPLGQGSVKDGDFERFYSDIVKVVESGYYRYTARPSITFHVRISLARSHRSVIAFFASCRRTESLAL